MAMDPTRIFHNMNPRQERMPKETGLGGKPRMKHVALAQPELMVQNNPRVQQNLAPFKLDARRIRAETARTLQEQVHGVSRHISEDLVRKGLEFGLHEASGKQFVQVKNARTGEVLKQYPAEEILELGARLRRMTGFLVDTQG